MPHKDKEDKFNMIWSKIYKLIKETKVDIEKIAIGLRKRDRKK